MKEAKVQFPCVSWESFRSALKEGSFTSNVQKHSAPLRWRLRWDVEAYTYNCEIMPWIICVLHGRRSLRILCRLFNWVFINHSSCDPSANVSRKGKSVVSLQNEPLLSCKNPEQQIQSEYASPTRKSLSEQTRLDSDAWEVHLCQGQVVMKIRRLRVVLCENKFSMSTDTLVQKCLGWNSTMGTQLSKIPLLFL